MQTGSYDHHGHDIAIYEDYVKFHKGDPVVSVNKNLDDTAELQQMSPLDALYEVLEFFESHDIDLRLLSKKIKNLEKYKGALSEVLSILYKLSNSSNEIEHLLDQAIGIIYDEDPNLNKYRGGI